MKLKKAEIFLRPVKEHRISVVFRGDNLSDKLTDADPQKDGMPAQDAKVLDNSKDTKETAAIVNEFLKKSKEILSEHAPSNAILLRGFAKMVNIPSFHDVYKLTPAAIATYPMYKGLAQLAGMELLDVKGTNISDEFETLKNNWDKHDYFFVHIKKTDSYGEDGNFEKKVSVIEEVDKHLPALLDLDPDVIAITADHSTPAVLKGHSWHPVPVLIFSKKCLYKGTERFTESHCFRHGMLGRIFSKELMTLAMANAGKLNKYGA